MTLPIKSGPVVFEEQMEVHVNEARFDAVLSRRDLVRIAGVGSAAVVAIRLGAGFESAAAQDATPVTDGGMPPLPEGAVLVAGGLMGPRYIAIAEDGTLYVSEAGAGGDEEVMAPAAADATPTAAAPLGTRGMSGQVSAIAADGTATVVASGIASYNFEGPVGPAGIVLAADKICLAGGGAGPATAFLDPLPTENSVLSIDPATGEFTVVADIGANERTNNPEPFAIDSDVYGMDLGPDGMLYVADAGGNCVYKVDPATGEITLVAVIPGIEVPAEMVPEGGNPARGGSADIDPVPTSVAVAEDGTIYVSLLSGGPFPPGGAKVVKIAADGTVSDHALGLTMVTDVAFGPDGNLYAVQLSTNFLQQTPDPGSVVRILADGTFEPVVEGLLFPNGIAFDAAGNLFIAAGTVIPMGGMILRVDGIAPAA